MPAKPGTGSHAAAPARAGRRRPALVVVIYASLTAAITGAFLFSPRVPDTSHICGQTVDVGRLSFLLNCDSPAFIALAVHPEGLFDWGDILQERPLYIVAAAPLAHALAPALVRLGLVPAQASEALTGFSLNWRRVRPGEAFAAYVAYVLLNGALLLGALVTFHYLVSGWTLPEPSLVALASLLVANDVVKPFFWTPHTQMFNILVPVGCMAVCRALLKRAQPGVLFVGALGLAVGIASLAYGSFALCIPALAIALALGRGTKKASLIRTAILVVAFAIPNLLWVGACQLVGGSYYNHAMVFYRQFVWILDAFKVGWRNLASTWVSNSWVFLQVAWRAVHFPLAVLLGALVCGRIARVSLRNVVRDHRPTAVAAALTLGSSVLFFDLQGFYTYRLAWNLVPPLLLVAALVDRQIQHDAARKWRIMTRLLAVGTAVTWLIHEVVKAGPWA